MGAAPVHFSSLDGLVERIVGHIRREHHTALVGSPGCGITTFATDLAAEIANYDFRINRFDARVKTARDLEAELAIDRPTGAAQQVVILDHVANLPAKDFQRLHTATSKASEKNRDIFLWCGGVDARAARLCSVPSAFVSFPILSRDELLSAYSHIAAQHGCQWSDTVLYLLLDLCGTDLSLVESLTNYLSGDWRDTVYDDTVWDRINDWLQHDKKIDDYRSGVDSLRGDCDDTIALVRFGGKPICKGELIDEPDNGVRRLCLNGILIPNLLPDFYQLRNLIVRFLLDESIGPEFHFRRATSERVGALLQDAETMLRQILLQVFSRIGLEAARTRLERITQHGEVIDAELNRALLAWAKVGCGQQAVKELSEILLLHRKEFKKNNSVWESTRKMIDSDIEDDISTAHTQCLHYLTLDQLGQLLLASKDEVFPRLNDPAARKLKKEVRFRQASEPAKVIDNWRESLGKVRRLRNQVAHLRNVGFQDMKDLTTTLERMRLDVILYGGWQPPAAAAVP